MGSRPEPIPLRRTKGPKRQFIGLDGVGWANVTTLIVSPKLVRLLVIRGKYLITSGLLLGRILHHGDTKPPRKAQPGGTCGSVLAESRQPRAESLFSRMKSPASPVYRHRNQLLDRAVPTRARASRGRGVCCRNSN